MKKVNGLAYGVGVFLTMIGMSAVVSGLMLIIDPTGGKIKLPLELLDGSPFSDYLIPGIVLFTANGLFSLVSAFLSFKKHRWSGPATIANGVVMLIWICAEVYWIGGESFLQPTMFGVGIFEIIIGLILHVQLKKKEQMFIYHL